MQELINIVKRENSAFSFVKDAAVAQAITIKRYATGISFPYDVGSPSYLKFGLVNTFKEISVFAVKERTKQPNCIVDYCKCCRYKSLLATLFIHNISFVI